MTKNTLEFKARAQTVLTRAKEVLLDGNQASLRASSAELTGIVVEGLQKQLDLYRTLIDERRLLAEVGHQSAAEVYRDHLCELSRSIFGQAEAMIATADADREIGLTESAEALRAAAIKAMMIVDTY